MLANKENSAPIKLADFGVAVELPEEGYITSGKAHERLYVVQCICLFLKCSQEGLPLQFCILKNPKFRISPWNCLPLHMCNKALLLSCTVDHAEAVWWADWKTASSAIVSDIQVQKPNYFKHSLCCQPLKIILATAHDCEDDLLCSHSICGLIWIQEGCSLFLPANSSQQQYKIILLVVFNCILPSICLLFCILHFMQIVSQMHYMLSLLAENQATNNFVDPRTNNHFGHASYPYTRIGANKRVLRVGRSF